MPTELLTALLEFSRLPGEQAAAFQLAARGRRRAFRICLRWERFSMVSCVAGNSNNRLIASRTSAVPLDRDLEISSEMSAACLVSPIVSANNCKCFRDGASVFRGIGRFRRDTRSRERLIIDVVRDPFDGLGEFGDGETGTSNFLD